VLTERLTSESTPLVPYAANTRLAEIAATRALLSSGKPATVSLDAVALEVVCSEVPLVIEVKALEKSEKTPPKPGSDRPRRAIKRYSNRKLYDTRDSRYVTLLQIAEMIRAGEDVQIIDNATKEDKTEVTLALIISEELKSQPRSVPLVTLRNLIHQRGGKLLSQLREGPIGRLIPGVTDARPGGEEGSPDPAAPSGAIAPPAEAEPSTPPGWQQHVEGRIAEVLGAALRKLEADVLRLTAQVAALEAKLSGHGGTDKGGS
jgi:polyhydroxyalkanoate synthesis repressor PhaR